MTRLKRPGAGTGAVVEFAAGCALAAWCYGRVLTRDLEWWRSGLALVLLPVLVWAGARLAAAHWPWFEAGQETGPEGGPGAPERGRVSEPTPAPRPTVRKPMWVGLAALTALALIVSLA